ncbi:MAG: hypothetical protein ACTHMO_10020 [Rhodanobacteraceae bacterium]
MAFLEIDPKKFAVLLARGTHEGELRKFFVESRARLLMSGAKVQNMPHGREERVRVISERFPPKTDEVLRDWFRRNISLADPLSPEEVLLYLAAYFDEGEPLPAAEAQVICRSALVYLVADTPNAELLLFLKKSRDSGTVGGATAPAPEKVSTTPEAVGVPVTPIEPAVSMGKSGPESFQLAELLASVISGYEEAIDDALAPFAESTQLLVEALLRIRNGDVEAAKEKLKLLGDVGPESELLRSALARAAHHRDSSGAPKGVRMEIPTPLDEGHFSASYEIIGIYTNESDTGAVFVKPIFVVLDGQLRQLNEAARDRLFPDSGSVMTSRSMLRRQLRRRELVHWKVSEREGAEGRTRFHLDSELGPLIEAVRIQVPSRDVDEVRDRIKAYAAERRGQLGQQVMFLLADGVSVVSPKGADFARDEAFEFPWQSWGSLEIWLIEGHQYCLEASQGAASYLDLSPLDAAFRKLLKSLGAEQRLPITKVQRNELTARLRAHSGSEIASRARRIADSIDQISINEEELDEVLELLRSREIVNQRVDELVAIEHEKRQAEKVWLQDEISLLRKKKQELEKEGRHIEQSNRARMESASAAVREAFARAVREGASTLANAEVFKLLLAGGENPASQSVPVDGSRKVVDWVKRGALSQGDVIARLSMLGINRRRAFALSRLIGIAAAAGVVLVLKGGMARQCVQALVRQDRDVVAIVDIPMGLTSSDFLRQTLMDLAELQGAALLDADLSPIEIYAAGLIDLLVEQAVLDVPHPKPIMLSCAGGDFSMSIPIALRRLSLVLNLDTDWDESQLLLDQIDSDSLLLLPALQERLTNAISDMNVDDRKYIEPALVNALHTK